MTATKAVYATVIDARFGLPGKVVEFPPFGRDFCFVTRIVDYQPAKAAAHAFVVAEYDYTGEESWAESHFVDHPLMPGNLQLECGDQTSALIRLLDPRLAGKDFLLASKENVKYRGKVQPGDTLVIRSELVHLGGLGGRFRYQTWVKGTEPKIWAVSAEITFFIPKK